MVELSAQIIGVIAGVIVFCMTVVATFVLLVVGGSFKRMREQAETYSVAGPAALKQTLNPRPELYDELLEKSRSLPKAPAPPSLSSGADRGFTGVGAEGELRGQHVTLRVLRCSEDAQKLFEACNGTATLGHAYDPDLALWCFSPYGPFTTKEELASSPLMQTPEDGLRFTVFDRETGSTIGMAAILANEPSCLRAEIGDVWLNPAYRESIALQDVFYLLLGHLFGLGYRRVETKVDADDTVSRKVLTLAGFLLEGVLRKHMIVKLTGAAITMLYFGGFPLMRRCPLPFGVYESGKFWEVLEGCNRDTTLFSMVNSDWRDGARHALEKKLAQHGSGANSRRARGKFTVAKSTKAGETAAVPTVASEANGSESNPPASRNSAVDAEAAKKKV